MNKDDFWLKNVARALLARGLRLAVIQNQYDAGNLTEAQARILLARPLSPGKDDTLYDDSDELQIEEPR